MEQRVAHRKVFETSDQMMAAVNSYFDESDRNKLPYTVSGLCLAIGFSRDMFLRRAHDPAVSEVLTQAKLLIEQQYELLLLMDHRKTASIVFALKNLGWSDSKQLDIGLNSLGQDDREQLKWTIEVIAPGEDGNTNKEKPKIKSEIPYDPPAQSDPGVEYGAPVDNGKTVIDMSAVAMPEEESGTGAKFEFVKTVGPRESGLCKKSGKVEYVGDMLRIDGKVFPAGGAKEDIGTEPVEVRLKNEPRIPEDKRTPWMKSYLR